MKKLLVLIYGLVCYGIFFATFLYAIGFVGNLLVPKSMDAVSDVPLGTALLIDIALLGVFAVQHSLMARPFFKRAWTRIIPAATERSTYVLFSSLALMLLFYFWQPLGGQVWQVDNSVATIAIYGVFALGWLLVLFSTCLINHFDLFGLRQSWLYFKGKKYTPVEFVEPWLYRVVRHPLYVGFIAAFWATPTMTVTHLLFAMATTAYILIAIRFEEHDLANAHPEYRNYKKQVPMLIPRFKTGAVGQAAKRASA